MQVPNGKSHLCSIKSGSFFWESCSVSQMHKQFTTSDEPHYEKYLLLSLEHVVHTYQEWVIGLHQYILFELGAFNLIVINNNIFSK
jgi:hypothetical protein